MIPLNATEAADLLRHRERERAQCERQIEHFGKRQENERARLRRLQAECALLAAFPTTSDPKPVFQTGERG